MGIVLGVEDLKDYVGDLKKAKKSGTRRNLYGSNPQRLAMLSLAHAKFIDKEVVITMPEKWTEANTKLTIDKHQVDGFMTRMVLSILTTHQGLHFLGQMNISNPLLALFWWITTLACNCTPK